MAGKEVTVKSDLKYTGKPRHLLVFMDGTWNDENGVDNDGITTNIYKLFRALEGDLSAKDIPHTISHEEHIALYFRGIGNDDDNSMLGSFFYGAFGGGEKRIRDHAYVSIVEHYRKGDKISIFGFSRGSASARLLASDLNKEGIANAITIHSKKEENASTGVKEWVYKKYSNISDTRLKPAPVEFLGVFDTVGAFGIPVDFGLGFQKINLFKDLTVAQNVKKVVHCVSIDESRSPFVPTLCNRAEHIDEVWFSGVHSDIGGGYRHSHLSHIPLAYMLSQLKKTFASNPIAFKSSELDVLTRYAPSDEYQMHHHGDDGMAKEARQVTVFDNGKPSKHKPKVHSSVFDLMKSKNVFLNTPMESFSKIDAIRYWPKSINGLNGHCIKVK